jgi:eukaryotic-like serine/threonine-protein kinase
MSHLGRMLAEYYFPEEAEQVRQRIASSGLRHSTAEAPSETRASADVLGLSYEDLGLGVAQSWGLPDSLRKVMSLPTEDVPGRLIEAPTERMRWRVRASAEMVQLLLDADPAQADSRVLALGERYARALDLRPEDFGAALKLARVHLSEMAATLKIEPPAKAPARRLLATLAPPAPLPAAPAQPALDADTLILAPQKPSHEQAEAVLSAGIAEVTSSMAADSFKLNEVLRVILGTIHKGIGFDRVVFCLRDPKTGLLTGRIGLGDGADVLAKRFCIDARGPQAADLFAAACLKGADTMIADARSASLAPRLPAWYRGAPAMSFLLLPLMLKSASFALIYADRTGAAIDFGERELSLLRTLRNQAVMAFKSAA